MPGTVNYADWTFSWSIPQLSGEGVVISKARFKGKSVLYQATQPFVLVPYHGDSPTFKDGLNPQGAFFTAVLPTAPDAPYVVPPGGINDNQYDPVQNPTGAVVIEKVAATLTEPAKAVIWAKLQAANYQYIHWWEFKADGSVEAKVGLGAQLFTKRVSREGHIHNFYFRLDFDIVTAANNLAQRFGHLNNAPGSDVWTDITVEAKQSADPKQFTKWRVVNKQPVGTSSDSPRFRSYELIPGSDGLPDGTYSTGDVWVVRYKPNAEDGSDVGTKDDVIGTKYVNGESVNGEDIVVWYCLRTHHQPRQFGEEKKVLPYEFIGFQLQPRDFLDDTIPGMYPTTPVSP